MAPIPVLTEEEALLVKRYIVLPLMLDVLERDIKVLETAAVRLKMMVVYVSMLRRLQDRITADLMWLRKKMRERGLKVYEQERTKLGVEARYLCRGYHYHFSMLWGLVRAEIEQRLNIYVGQDGEHSDRSMGSTS